MKQRIICAAFAFFAAVIAVAPVQAHGKNVIIDVQSNTLDPLSPLTKHYLARLTYDDGDKVDNAKLLLTALRSDGNDSVGPLGFERTDAEGVYQTNVTYPTFGEWKLKFQVLQPGEGEATLTENIEPPSVQNEPTRVRAAVPLVFDARDALNVGVRTLHIFSAISWFAVIVMLFVAPRVLAREAWKTLLARGGKSLPNILGVIWMLLLVTGIYLAINNAPTREPGLLAPDMLLRLRWGREYLIAFIVKILMFGGALVVGIAIGHTMKQPNNLTAARVEKLVALDLILGFFIFADVVVIGYLHNLSHLGLVR